MRIDLFKYFTIFSQRNRVRLVFNFENFLDFGSWLYLILDLKRQNDDNLKKLRTYVNRTSYERFEIWFKYFHTGGNFHTKPHKS